MFQVSFCRALHETNATKTKSGEVFQARVFCFSLSDFRWTGFVSFFGPRRRPRMNEGGEEGVKEEEEWDRKIRVNNVWLAPLICHVYTYYRSWWLKAVFNLKAALLKQSWEIRNDKVFVRANLYIQELSHIFSGNFMCTL